MIAVLVAVLATIAPSCPVPPVQAPVVVPYRAPACRWCAGQRGVEYATKPGTPVTAVAEGVVTFAGSVAGTRYVVLLQPDGLKATYGKLAQVDVVEGQRIAIGTVVGTSGVRLYFGWRRTVDGVDQPVDPTPVLGRWLAHRRLLPPAGVPPRPTLGSRTGLRMVCPAGASRRAGR